MATSLPLVLLVLAALAAAAVTPAAAQQQEYCRDSLAGLMECQGFMHGSGAASASCCAAYEAAFNADPFCLCYVADGTFARAMGNDVDFALALQIPVSCGQAAPPVELCNMQGLVLPPYEPKGTPPVAAAPGGICSGDAATFRRVRAAVLQYAATTTAPNLRIGSCSLSIGDHPDRRLGRGHGLKFAIGSN